MTRIDKCPKCGWKNPPMIGYNYVMDWCDQCDMMNDDYNKDEECENEDE